jgi:Protein of unknown function (DUF4238)
MGLHYVPSFYLGGFTTGKTIWAHDREEGRSFPSQPKSVANETAMYPIEVEKYFACKVEDPAKGAIEKIRSRQPITESERAAIAKYVIALWKRVPDARSRIAQQTPKAAASVRENLHQRLDSVAASDPKFATIAEAHRQEVDRIIEKYENDPSADIWHMMLGFESTPRVQESFLSMTWRFLYSEHAQFLTSDNPVFFFKHEGVGQASSKLTVPFSSSVVLWANWKPRLGPLYSPATPAVIRELNRRMANNATRIVYSARNEPWILRFASKTDHALSRLV